MNVKQTKNKKLCRSGNQLNQKTSQKTLQKTLKKPLPISKISCVVPRSADVLACQEKCNLFFTEKCRIVLAGEWRGGRIETKGKLTE